MALADTLDNLDGAGNYADWILAQVEPHLGEHVLEVGARHGTFTAMLSARGYHVVATDVSERCVGNLYSDFDRQIGHYRRYTRKGLREQLTRAGYDVPVLRYHNAVGALAWLVVAQLLHRDPTGAAPVKVYDSCSCPP